MTIKDKLMIGTCVRAFAFGAAMVLCKSIAATVIIGSLFAADIIGSMWLQYKCHQKKKAPDRRLPVKSNKMICISNLSIHHKAGDCQDG